MQRRVTQIESIRVLAMFAIFFYHVWTVLPDGGAQNPFGPILGDIMSQGYLGVVVFNAITGFVLTLPHANPGGKPSRTTPMDLPCDSPYIAIFIFMPKIPLMPTPQFFRLRFGNPPRNQGKTCLHCLHRLM